MCSMCLFLWTFHNVETSFSLKRTKQLVVCLWVNGGIVGLVSDGIWYRTQNMLVNDSAPFVDIKHLF